MQRHAREFGFGMTPLRDPKHVLVARAGASVTPEAGVVRPPTRV